jgi:hypothetical protein
LTGEIPFLFSGYIKAQERSDSFLTALNQDCLKIYGSYRMADNSNANEGIRLLIRKCRNKFRRSENIDFYSENDFAEAEKKFVKFCLTGNPGNSYYRTAAGNN